MPPTSAMRRPVIVWLSLPVVSVSASLIRPF